MGIKKTDMILINANIISMDDRTRNASSVAVCGERIVAVGDQNDILALKDSNTEIIDLKGKTLIPGFIESHAHPLYYAEQCINIKLTGEATASVKNVLKCIADAAEKTPKGEWLFGWGWDEAKFEEGQILLTKELLDKAAPDNPVFVKRTCGHVGALNSLGLKLCGIDRNTPVPVGGDIFKDADGEPTGIVAGAIQKMIPMTPPSDEQLMDVYAGTVQNELLSKGITTASDMAAEPRFTSIYQRLHCAGNLKIRMRFWPMARKNVNFDGNLNDVLALGLRSGLGDDMLRFEGLKYLMDGSTGGKTSAVSEPFEGDPENYGTLYNELDSLTEDIIRATKAGLRASMHAIGDRAIEMALQSLEAAAKELDIPSMRNRLEHVELPTDDHIARMKRLGLVIGSSSGFIYALGDSHYNVLGQRRLPGAFPLKKYIENGIIAACNNDCPVCDINPILGIYSMVTRNTMGGKSFGKEQAISRMDALKCYTVNAAYATFDEEKIGSISEGKYADMAVLSEDILSTDEEKIKDIKVEMTIVNGKILFQRKA